MSAANPYLMVWYPMWLLSKEHFHYTMPPEFFLKHLCALQINLKPNADLCGIIFDTNLFSDSFFVSYSYFDLMTSP